jgi:serine/threonine kinase PknH
MGLSRIHCTHVRAAIDTPADIAPPGEPRQSRKGRIVGGPAATLAAMGMVVVLAGCSGHGTPTTTPIPTVAPERLDSILLTDQEAGTILGAKGVNESQLVHKTDATERTLSIRDCLGAYLPATDPVYKDSGYTAISAASVVDNDDSEHWVQQTVVGFPSPDQALAFVKSSAAKWKACAGQYITSTVEGGYSRWTFGPLVGDAPKIALLKTKEAGNGLACQRALGAVSNVVIDVMACGYNISDQARQTVDKIAAKATPVNK